MTVLQESITKLEARVARLEETIKQFVNKQPENLDQVAPSQPAPLTQAQISSWLASQGIIRTPTLEEEQLAAEWDELSEQAKQEHIAFMQQLRLVPPLSETILEARR